MNELFEVFVLCNCRTEPPGALHCRPSDTDDLESWRQWLRNCFVPLLLPHLSQVLALAVHQRVEEIISLDCVLDQNLDQSVREKSTRAGHGLLRGTPLRGDRTLVRLKQAIDTGAAAGHYLTVFACRAAAFSLPASTVFLAYCWQELHSHSSREKSLDDFLYLATQVVSSFVAGSSYLPPPIRLHG
jgi:hypothetical protein